MLRFQSLGNLPVLKDKVTKWLNNIRDSIRSYVKIFKRFHRMINNMRVSSKITIGIRIETAVKMIIKDFSYYQGLSRIINSFIVIFWVIRAFLIASVLLMCDHYLFGLSWRDDTIYISNENVCCWIRFWRFSLACMSLRKWLASFQWFIISMASSSVS